MPNFGQSYFLMCSERFMTAPTKKIGKFYNFDRLSSVWVTFNHDSTAVKREQPPIG